MLGAVLLQVVLIFLNATFASAEIAVISMNATRLAKMAEDGDKRALASDGADLPASPFSGHDPGGYHPGGTSRQRLCR